ncbi:MAG TPA: PQQ-binding-like beta-propeller repeat protein [Ktedonobacterales bacterium]|nr:PQQ-binding-like beta-propeller repeat protein [Ktedonobacterales bacterium]
MGTLTLECASYTIALEDSVALQASEAADARTIALGEQQYRPTTVVRVAATREGAEAWSLTLTSTGGGTTIHSSGALCLGLRVVVAIGPYVVALDAGTGELAWQRQCDPATCFAVFRAPGSDGLITHGELQIARLSADGELTWTYQGKDIFTGPFEVVPEGILATDFTGDVYALDLDGNLQAMDKGKPFPH